MDHPALTNCRSMAKWPMCTKAPVTLHTPNPPPQAPCTPPTSMPHPLHTWVWHAHTFEASTAWPMSLLFSSEPSVLENTL